MENVVLDGGLDMVRARPAVLAGRIRDCLNYESGWSRGCSRIDGFERFDGHTSPSATDYWIVVMPTSHLTGTVVDEPTDLIWTLDDQSDDAGVMVDYVDSPSTGGAVSSFAIVYRSGRLRPAWGATMGPEDGSWNFVLDEAKTSVYKLSEIYTTQEGFLSTLSNYAEKLRAEVQAVPGGGTIVGLHYHEDQLYAIRDVAQFTVVDQDGAVSLRPGMFVTNSADQIGEVLAVSADGMTVNVAPTSVNGFSVVSGDTIDICLSLRFLSGVGEFQPEDLATADTGWAGTYGYGELRDGSYDAGNANGVAVFYKPTTIADVSPGDTFTSAGNTMEVELIQFDYVAGATTVDATSTKSALATMWRSTDDGWERATTGRSIAFIKGLNDPEALPLITDETAWLDASETGFYSRGGYDTVHWTTPYDNILLDDGNDINCAPYRGVGGGASYSSDKIYAKGFKAPMKDKYTITGMQVQAKLYTLNPGTATLVATPLDGGTSQTMPGPNPQAYVMGPVATDSLWNTALTPERVSSDEFGFALYAYAGTLASQTLVFDHIQMKLRYTYPPGEDFILYDPVAGQDIGYLKVDSTVLVSGAWDDDDAAGYFRLTDWSTIEIPTGTQVWTDPGGTGLQIATIDGNVSIPSLPGSRLLEENSSKYQMISYNFFATEEQNAIYGVSGAGLAFWYDGETLDFIPTGVPLEDDKPRHVAAHENRLALGYIWGEVYVSGVDPLNFDAAEDFAGSFGFGDKITGLMPVAGNAMAVFTESSIWALRGAPSPESSVEQTVINHKVGAIEYTVQNIGNRPIFASFRGIETLETMDQYSDFFTAPLTYDVSPWLLRRLQTAAGVETTDESVVNSVVVRNKNQYRLFFADGYVLTLTYVGPEKEPQNTIQQYWFASDRKQYMRVYATASGVSTRGQDHAFVSAEERPDRPRTTAVLTPYIDYVYELDRGRSFDGGEIESFFTLTHNFSQQQSMPMAVKRYNGIHMHGTGAGYSSLRVSRAVNYELLDDPVLPYEDAYFGALSNPAEDQQTPKYAKARLTARGFAVSVHVSHKSATEFPHNIQLITFLDDQGTKVDR